MPAEVTLSSAARNSLLALRRTTDLIQFSQRRISSGLRVANAADNTNAFFRASALRVRAADFLRRKESIDQGISSAEAGKTAADAIKELVDQLQSIATSLKTATSAASSNSLVRQFNDLRTQINNVAADASYQGVNLVGGTGQALRVEISESGDGYLRVDSTDLTSAGAGVPELRAAVSGNSVIEVVASTGNRPTGGIYEQNAGAKNAVSQISALYRFTYQGPDDAFTAGVYDIRYGDKTLTIRVENNATVKITQGRAFNVAVASSVESTGNSHKGSFNRLAVVNTSVTVTPGMQIDLEAADPGESPYDYITGGAADAVIDTVLDRLDAAESAVRAAARRLGTNVDLLKSRLEFNEDYAETLKEGADKLTVLDVTAEQARLTSLQTRRRLGVSSLSAAAQSERGILALLNQALSQNDGGLWFQAGSLLENGAASG